MTVAVIFSSTRSTDHDQEYAAMAGQMEALAIQQPGYLGLESVRDRDGRGITVSYWASDEHAKAWKQVAEHLQAQELGRQVFYTDYHVVVAQVIREYSSAGQ